MKVALLLLGLLLSNACARECSPTEPIRAQAPEGTDGTPFDWFVNADRSIWVLNQDWVSGERMKVAWFRPGGRQLVARGRRLDGVAPEALIDFPLGSAYPGRFTPSGMTFPTEGCWEITAKVDDRELRFVIAVRSR